MPRIKQSTSISLYSFHLPLLMLAAGVFAVSVLAGSQIGKSGQSAVLSKSSEKPDKTVKQTNPNKPTVSPSSSLNKGLKTTNGGTDTLLTGNAKIHKDKVEKVSSSLSEIAQEVEDQGETVVSNELEEAAEEIDSTTAEDTADAIDAVESQPKWKVLLIGTDFKNLGQLRSTIAKNENTIRKLTRTVAKVEGTDAAIAITAQIQALQQEQTRLANIVRTNESQFSLLGWVFKFINGYPTGTQTNIGGTDVPESTESTQTTGTENSSL